MQRIVPCEMSFEVTLRVYLLDSTSFNSTVTGKHIEPLHQMKFQKQLFFFIILFCNMENIYIAHQCALSSSALCAFCTGRTN